MLQTIIFLFVTIGCFASAGVALSVSHVHADSNRAHATVHNPMSAQIIIKFVEKVHNPSEKAFIEKLSWDAGATLVYLRPLSGGAHVFRVEGIPSAAQLAGVIKRLSLRSDVLYAEQDRILQRQQDK